LRPGFLYRGGEHKCNEPFQITDNDPWPGLTAPAQVKTVVPPIEDGAKPVAVDRIKIHGTSLEGNLEGEEVDREALVFLPPSYATAKSRRYPVVYALHGYSIAPISGPGKSMCRRQSRARFAKGAREDDRVRHVVLKVPWSGTEYMDV